MTMPTNRKIRPELSKAEKEQLLRELDLLLRSSYLHGKICASLLIDCKPEADRVLLDNFEDLPTLVNLLMK